MTRRASCPTTTRAPWATCSGTRWAGAFSTGSGAGLALAMMHVIIGEDLHDREYVEKYTLGFERLKERVKEYPPEKVAKITGLAADRIVALAREYAGTRPAAIRLNYGLQRHA